MTKQQHKKALNCLKSINNLQRSKNYSLKKGVIRYEFKHQIIQLDDMTMIVSGTWEQFNTKNHSQDMVFLVISLYDQDNQELAFNDVQLDEYLNELKPKLITA